MYFSQYNAEFCFFFFAVAIYIEGLPQWLSDKEYSCQVGDSGLIPGLGISLGEENDNPPQYSCLGNPMDRGAWWATVHGATKESDTT